MRIFHVRTPVHTHTHTLPHCPHSRVLLNCPYRLSTSTLLSLMLKSFHDSAAMMESGLPHSPSWSRDINKKSHHTK